MDDAVVEVEGLVKVFKGDVRALDGLSLAVQPGSVYGLLGPNGAGKTTLIRVLATLLQPDGGTARVAGVDVRADPARVRARIGLAGQSAAVDEVLTGRENVEMVGRLYGLSRRQARQRASVPVRCWSAFAWWRRQTGRSRPTQVGCAAGLTWAPPWSAGPACCSWTSRPLGWTRPAAATCGR